VVRMDVMRISPRTNSSYEGMRAASQAFRLAAAFLLELDPRSLALADILEDGLNTIYLVDLTDGGSGLLERLQEPARCRAWLALARRILSHEHRPSEACANACPECLLTHDNRAEHRHRPFRRLEGIATVDSLLSDLEGGGESRRAGAEPSAEKDTDGSWEEVEGLTCLSLSVIHALREGGAPVPEVGRDLLFEDVIVANAEICWMKQRVAVLTQEGELRPIPEWTLLAATDPRLAENALAALLC